MACTVPPRAVPSTAGLRVEGGQTRRHGRASRPPSWPGGRRRASVAGAPALRALADLHVERLAHGPLLDHDNAGVEEDAVSRACEVEELGLERLLEEPGVQPIYQRLAVLDERTFTPVAAFVLRPVRAEHVLAVVQAVVG